jgi:integrase
VVSTARGYQNTLRLFMEYITDARYAWPRECEEKFGQVPVQILHEWNTVAHVAEYEGDPRRRPLTYDEVQDLFDAADGRVKEIRARKRKGALAAMLLKTVYAYGLRRREAWGLDLADLRHNPKQSQGPAVRPVRRALRPLGQGVQGQPAQAADSAHRPGDGLDRARAGAVA